MKDFFTEIERSLGAVTSAFFPGLFLLDTIFDKGVLAGGISSIYEFILLVVWGFAISIPYLIIGYIAVQPNRLAKKDQQPGSYEWTFGIYSMLAPFVILLSLFTYLICKLLAFFFGYAPILGISGKGLLFVASIVLTAPTAFLMGKVYVRFILFSRRYVSQDKQT